MKILPISAVLTLSLISSSSYAFFCPNNFSQIDMGYTTAQVISACGKPDKEETKETDANVPQEWNFYVPSASSMGGPSNASLGTIKTSLAFDANNKLVNISINGVGVNMRNMCGTSISVGATREEVKAACGEPSSVVKDSSAQNAPKSKITTYTYKSNPPGTLTFTDGVLTGR